MTFPAPSEGAKRCMIYRHQRTLDDGCDYCGKSKTYCDGLAASEPGECCCQPCGDADRDLH